MAGESARIEIGFIGPQVLPIALETKELEALRKKLSSGGWLTVRADDGEIDIDLDKVAFVRVASSEHSVGFGA